MTNLLAVLQGYMGVVSFTSRVRIFVQYREGQQQQWYLRILGTRLELGVWTQTTTYWLYLPLSSLYLSLNNCSFRSDQPMGLPLAQGVVSLPIHITSVGRGQRRHCHSFTLTQRRQPAKTSTKDHFKEGPNPTLLLPNAWKFLKLATLAG